MGKVLELGEVGDSNYLDTLKHIQGDGVCESLAVLSSAKVLQVDTHWINSSDYPDADKSVTGNYECVPGSACCRVLGELSKQNYLLPVWQYKNRSVSLEGAFKIWKLPRKKYMALIDVVQREGLDLVDYDVHLVDATKNPQYPDYTIEIGRHKSELTREWRTAKVAALFGANLMDMMDVSVERRMDRAKWDELLFDKLKLEEPDGNELRHDGGGSNMALPGEAPVNNSLPPMESQAVPVETTVTVPVVNRDTFGSPMVKSQDIEVRSRVVTPVDIERGKSATQLNSLLDDKGGATKSGLPTL